MQKHYVKKHALRNAFVVYRIEDGDIINVQTCSTKKRAQLLCDDYNEAEAYADDMREQERLVRSSCPNVI
jgi:hypothetical protein